MFLQESRVESRGRRVSGDQWVLVCDSLRVGVLTPATAQVSWKLVFWNVFGIPLEPRRNSDGLFWLYRGAENKLLCVTQMQGNPRA